jgi:propionyl-CoA carboxylase alpha chain
MQFALNEFVIAGVHSNIPFQAALMQHPSFQAGDFNTGFIAEHFPDGFHGLSPSVAEQELLSAIATTIHLGYLARSLQISGQLDGHTLQTPTSFEVLVGPSGQQSSISTTVKYSEKGLWVEVGQQHLCIESDWHVGSTLYRAQINGQPYSLQVARQGVFYILQMNGICFQSMVMTTSNATLQKLMPMKVAPDLSQYLLSPMPGLLVQVAVQVGQKVQAGERLAAIEAMKMENILFASQVGVVAEILVEQGQSLSVDQVIMRFE